MQVTTLALPLAAIDIGSNAMRMVIGEMDRHGDIRIMKKVREPVRLGKDVFGPAGEISKKSVERAVESFRRFQAVLKEQRIEYVRAVATSALREAKNRDAFITMIQEASGIRIEVIDGLEEARLIHSAVAARLDIEDKNALLIDIGGGSVELTLSAHGEIRGLQTFKLGTVRLLERLEERGLKEKHLRSLINEQLPAIEAFIRDAAKGEPIDVCVGTGGNFECLGKLRVALLNRSSIFSMTSHELLQLTEHLGSMTIKERIQYLRLRPDRADVVMPASLVAEAILTMIPVETLLIPFVGLRDGILADLADKTGRRTARA